MVIKMIFKVKNFSELTTDELYEILKARSQVFMLEQNIHCQDMDDVDRESRHYFFEEDGKVLGYLRAFYTDDTMVRIGRVLTTRRGVGLGADIMRRAIADIRKNMPCRKIHIDAQKHAVGFYEKLDFKPVSGEFLEEGIVHIAMQMNM